VWYFCGHRARIARQFAQHAHLHDVLFVAVRHSSSSDIESQTKKGDNIIERERNCRGRRTSRARMRRPTLLKSFALRFVVDIARARARNRLVSDQMSKNETPTICSNRNDSA
jgi:hypothetical protein